MEASFAASLEGVGTAPRKELKKFPLIGFSKVPKILFAYVESENAIDLLKYGWLQLDWLTWIPWMIK